MGWTCIVPDIQEGEAMKGLAGTGSPDLQSLAEQIDSRFLQLTDLGRMISLAVHRTLALGDPVPDDAIAAATGLEIRAVREEMAGWPGVDRDDCGRIIGFWGLTIGQTDHRFVVEGRTLYTWCAWDALFLPEIIGKNADVSSRSGASGAEIAVRVTSQGAVSTDGGDVVVSFVDPERCDVEGDRVISTFCCHILFFSTREEGERWASEQGNGAFILSLDEAFELGRRSNALMYGDTLTD